MNLYFCATVLICLVCLPVNSVAKKSEPKVQVYTRTPGELGKENTLICHVSNFYPPEISIELLRNGEEIPGALQTDLTFEENWQYHLTKHVPFTPGKGEIYSCRVTHMGNPKPYIWEPDM